jgi:hypothetical protein
VAFLLKPGVHVGVAHWLLIAEPDNR